MIDLKKSKKTWALCILLVCICTTCVLLWCNNGGKESPAEDFDYEMVDGEVIITGYHGGEREIHIPKKINDRPVTKIGEAAFRYYDMISIFIPEGVEKIDDFAFDSCATLEKIKLPNSLEKIGINAFTNCENLMELELPPDFTGFYFFSDATWKAGYIDSPVSSNTTVIVKNGSTVHKMIEEYKRRGLINGTLNYSAY